MKYSQHSMRFRCIQVKLDKPLEMNSCWKNMGVDFTVLTSATPREDVKNIDWIGLGQLGTGFIICARVDKSFINLVPNFLPKITYPVRCCARRKQRFQQLPCMLDFWYTCCSVYLHSSPILGLYVVILRATQSAVLILRRPRAHISYTTLLSIAVRRQTLIRRMTTLQTLILSLCEAI